MKQDAVRARLVALVDERGTTLAALSRAIAKNHAYLQQFVKRGTPRLLPEDVHQALADYLKVPEGTFRPTASGRGVGTAGRPGAAGIGSILMAPDMDAQTIAIPELDARAGAGNLGQVEHPEETGRWVLPPAFLRYEFRANPQALYIITVEGDSMSPTLAPGDRIFVDTSRTSGPDGLYVLHNGDGLQVKRLERVMGTDRLRVISDNPHHSAYELPAEQVHVMGRVVGRVQRL